MPLSWNEIRSHALTFSKHWADAANEDAQAKPFLIAFFEVFGITDKRFASFEHAAQKYDGSRGYVDAFWPGILLVEMKSRGKNLERAYSQAMDYFPGIKERDLPRYVLVCDFARFRLYDLKEGSVSEFALIDFYKNVRLFGFIAGYQTQVIQPQDPINIRAAEHMGRLHDKMKAVGYTGRPLEIYLVRLLFCLFSEDTGIFDKRQFQDFIEQRTEEDGADLADRIATLFHVLNTPAEQRLKNLDEQLAAFPYINGRLFEEALPPAGFDAAMREALLDLCGLDWSLISPAIFGSLFQSIMDDVARRNLGAHYTSEENIQKLIKPLFLDELRAEFEKIKKNRNKLFEFHKKLRSLKFFDPACGCGNFLAITYRELRLLELDVLRAARADGQQLLDIHQLVAVDVDQFYGIEIEEFPAQIAQVALWLVDHQMNIKVSEEFGSYFVRIPLKHAATIVHGNALQLDWNAVLPAPTCSYVLGNPPFVGAKYMNDAQRADTRAVFTGIDNAGLLDFVAAWYVKAARYMDSARRGASPHPDHLPASGAKEPDSPRPTPWGEGLGVRGDAVLSKPHRRDPVTEEKLKTYARELRASPTDAEHRLWQILRDRRFFDFKFRRQHPVAGYILDFYCAESKLAVELDGGQHDQQAAYDAQRERVLAQQGITVLRFWNNEFLRHPEGVLEALAMALGVFDLPPLPSPPAPLPAQRGEGSVPRAAFVSTNSITQGEQVGALWGWLLAQGVKIHFAHRTFSWSNEARGKAAVHCVIIGFGLQDVAEKTIFEYADIKGEAHAIKAANINPYLVDAPDVVLPRRSRPIGDVPEIGIGNKPIDGGNYLFTPEEKAAFLAKEPAAAAYFRRWIGADEFINGYERWCLWLGDCPPEKLRAMPEALKRVQAVKALRLASKSAPTRKLAETPTRFHVEFMPDAPFMVIPEVSSERRTYIPMGYAEPPTLASNKLRLLPTATLFHFGVLISTMHMAWVRYTTGRLKSDFQYSISIVYNNFPWPDIPSPQPPPRERGEGAGLPSPDLVGRVAGGEGRTGGKGRIQAIEAAAQGVLDARAAHPGATLADLYDPLTMPPDLVKAHQKLDAAVDAAYGYKGAATDAARVAFLFARYQALTSLLPAQATKTRRGGKAKT
jgi:very-short-patch-repair endonuclease